MRVFFIIATTKCSGSVNSNVIRHCVCVCVFMHRTCTNINAAHTFACVAQTTSSFIYRNDGWPSITRDTTERIICAPGILHTHTHTQTRKPQFVFIFASDISLRIRYASGLIVAQPRNCADGLDDAHVHLYAAVALGLCIGLKCHSHGQVYTRFSVVTSRQKTVTTLNTRLALHCAYFYARAHSHQYTTGAPHLTCASHTRGIYNMCEARAIRVVSSLATVRGR